MNSRTKTRTAILIRTADDAQALLANAARWRSAARPDVVVNMPALSESEQLRWTRRLGFWLNACGCQTGALFTMVAIVVCTMGLPVKAARVPATLLRDVGFVIAAALVGKVLGLLGARIMLHVDLRRLVRRARIAIQGGAE